MGSLPDHPLWPRRPLLRLDPEEPLLHPGAFVTCISSWNICVIPVMLAQRSAATQLGHQDPQSMAGPCRLPQLCLAPAQPVHTHRIHSPSPKVHWPRSSFLVGQHASRPRDELVKTEAHSPRLIRRRLCHPVLTAPPLRAHREDSRTGPLRREGSIPFERVSGPRDETKGASKSLVGRVS